MRQGFLELAKAQGLRGQLVQQEQFPAATDQVEGVGDTAKIAEDFPVAAVGGGGFASGHYFLFCAYRTIGCQLAGGVAAKVVLPLTKPFLMNVLLVFAHPEPQSFNGAMLRTALATLEAAGHSVQVSDLYAQAFEPVSGRANFTTVYDAAYFKQQKE
jgi:hypothetical protein